MKQQLMFQSSISYFIQSISVVIFIIIVIIIPITNGGGFTV